MGYRLKMKSAIKLEKKAQKQIENWREELGDVEKALTNLESTKELQGEAGKTVRSSMSGACKPLKARIEELLNAYQETLSAYVQGLQAIEGTDDGVIYQDTVEERQELLMGYEKQYVNIGDEIQSALNEITDLFGYSLPYPLPEAIEALIKKAKDINRKIGEYNESHMNDTSEVDAEIEALEADIIKGVRETTMSE